MKRNHLSVLPQILNSITKLRKLPSQNSQTMDADISRWVLEFLLRSSVPDSLISKTLAALPLSGADSRLKKTLLLRTLQSLHSKASITETALEILELVEELDRNDAVPVTDSMRRAYCAVAVECTVKYLAACPDDSAGEYFAAVRRIWRGRVAEMENAGRRSVLFSGELARWRDDVEAAVWDPSVCERLAGLNSRTEALNEVKVYLKEAWEMMGPSFLETVAAMAKAKGLPPDGVCGFAFGGETMKKREGGLEGSGKEGRDFVGGSDRSESEEGDDDGACCMEDENQGKEEELEERVGASVDGDQELGGCDLPAQGEEAFGAELMKKWHRGLEITGKERRDFVGGDRNELDDDSGGACCMEDVAVTGENQGKEQLEETFGDSVNRNQGLGGSDLPAQGEKAFGDELMRKRHGGLEGSGKDRMGYDGGDRSELHDDGGGGACCMEDVAVTGENQGKEQLEDTDGAYVDGNQELGGYDLPAQGEKVQNGNLELKHKHSALRKCHRGVKISCAEEEGPAKSLSKYDPVSSLEVKKVRESLKSSSLELRTLVKDPLPDALHMSEVIRSKLGTKDINPGPPIEYQSGDVDVRVPDVCKSIVPYKPSDANLGKKSSVHCSNVHRPNIMERRSTARTYEWDDSIDNLPQARQPRRRKRKWTSLEEETLRAGVKMFGEGNWAAIRSYYSNIFENRSGVDLKDKWRNMIR